MPKATAQVKRPRSRRSLPDQERAAVRKTLARAVKQEKEIRRLTAKLQREVQRTNDALQRLAGEFVPRMFGESKPCETVGS